MIDNTLSSQFPSFKLDHLVYIELEGSNGGMMLTVSEEGFSFRAVTPVRPNGTVPFSFTIHGTEKLGGYGQIEWVKEEGKVAGLRYTEVTTEFVSALRNWLAEISTPIGPSSDHTHDFEAKHEAQPTRSDGEPTASFVQKSDPDLNLNLASLRQQMSPPSNGPRPATSGSAVTNNFSGLNSARSWDYSIAPPEPSRRVSGVALAAVSIGLLALIIVLYGYRETLGQALISVGQKLSKPANTAEVSTKAPETTKPQPEPQTPAPSVKVPDQVPQSTDAPTDTHSGQVDAAPASKPTSTVQDTRYRPPASNSPRASVIPYGSNPQDEARALWSEVAQGNTGAEVTLAKLYLIGSGVTKSCDQARVLLRAAAKKGNVEAIDKLQQIEHHGCP